MKESYIIRVCTISLSSCEMDLYSLRQDNGLHNFIEFIKENDTDKNSNQQAVVEYHSWRLFSD